MLDSNKFKSDTIRITMKDDVSLIDFFQALAFLRAKYYKKKALMNRKV